MYQTVRQVQGVVDLDKQTNSQVTSLSDRLGKASRKLQEVTNSIDKSATPKRAASRPRETEVVKSEVRERTNPKGEASPDFGSAESYEESGEEEEPVHDSDRREVPEPPPREEGPKEPPPALSGNAPPPEPILPPRSEEARGHRDRSRSRNRGRRGGSRHPQQFRGLHDPQGPFREKRKKRRKTPYGGR